MNSHENARLTVHGRARLIERMAEVGVATAAMEAGISVRTACKWKARLEREGLPGLRDRSSRPGRLRGALSEAQQGRALALRQSRWTIRGIADHLGRPYATVRRYLAGAGLGRLAPMEPPPPVRRYEHPHPGSMLHLDTKKLGRIEKTGYRITSNRRDHTRGVGWEVLHLAIDDHSRLGYTEVLADERKDTTTGFLERALAWFSDHGVTVERLMTDADSTDRRNDFVESFCGCFKA